MADPMKPDAAKPRERSPDESGNVRAPATDERPFGEAPTEPRSSSSFESSPAPRSDVWPAPGRPSVEPPRPSVIPRRSSATELSRPSVGHLQRATWAIAALTQAERDGASDESLVRAFVDAIALHSPGLLVLVRLLDPQTGALGFVYANGKLLPDRGERLELSEASALAFTVSTAALAQASIELVPEAAPFFVSSSARANGGPAKPFLDVPLLDGDAVLGLVTIEDPAPESAAGDTTLLVTLGALLGASLRNARLERDAIFFRDYLAQTLEHASAPIFVLDRTRVVRSANRAALALMDAGRTDVIGKDFLSMVWADDHGRAVPALNSAFSGRATTALELAVVRRGADLARVAWNAAPIYDSDGDASAVVVIGHDLTEVHRLEEQILHAEKLATLGQLAAGIVHELNNPLTSITVYGEYLHGKAKRANAEPGDIEKLGRIVEGANRMARFTRDLVTYARPSSEDPTPLSIREVALESVRFCEHVLSDTGVVLTTNFADDLPPMAGVRGQLHQVFVNLVTNACHALRDAPAGTVDIDARRAPGISEQEEIIVRVTDNGPGISAEHLARIFDPFFTTKGEGKGTGLGLSIARKIVKAHRGTIEVITRHEGGATGTTFELRFPAV
jgi:two-component system NtrC family sensor kinase